MTFKSLSLSLAVSRSGSELGELTRLGKLPNSIPKLRNTLSMQISSLTHFHQTKDLS